MEGILRNVLKNNLKVKKSEKVLILTDMHKNPTKKQKDINLIAEKTAEIAKKFTNKVFLLKYPAVGRHSGPLPKTVEVAMLNSDVILGITWFSTSHTYARRKASKRGARIVTTPTIETSMLEKGGSVDVDYKLMSKRCKKMAAALKGKNQVQILGKNTDLKFLIKGRTFMQDDGILYYKGAFANLPAGEVYGAPIESSANGTLSAGCPKAVMKFERGKLVNFVGDEKLKKIIMEYNHRRTIAELGIGVNPNAKNPKNGLEAEKILGTIHIAVGDNISMGGKNKSDFHQDFVLFNPTLVADGKKLINRGKWLI